MRPDSPGFSPIFITAAVSIVALLAVVMWQMNRTLTTTGTPAALVPTTGTSTVAPPVFTTINEASASDTAATSSDPLSELGTAVINQLSNAYVQMQEAGAYSTSTVLAMGQSLAPYVAANVSYPTFSSADIQTDTDTSYTRMLQYRSDLRTALAPLLKNTEPEYAIFAQYVDTKDVTYLTKLQTIAQNYRTAASNTARVVVPEDAVPFHLAILDAMEEFASTLDAMIAHAGDPFASVALLRGYNQAESDMLNSFNTLTTYYKGKQQ